MIVLTDIKNEPDDAMSMVRFLTYCNQWDVEGLVATTSIHPQNKTATWRIREIAEWIPVRDGPNVLAQALWKVRATRSQGWE